MGTLDVFRLALTISLYQKMMIVNLCIIALYNGRGQAQAAALPGSPPQPVP